MRRGLPCHLLIITLAWFLTDTAGAQSPAATPKISGCRLDSSNNKFIQPTMERAIDAYAVIGKPLAITSIAINPPAPSTDGKTLDVYVVIDAAKGGTDPSGCATRVPRTPIRSIQSASVAVASSLLSSTWSYAAHRAP
ncbi:hypothetical protein BSZ19_43125 [Bradyrhizobium japonicum]|uniref:Uncharacterized protein n=2 Tax=Bradyrhizobium japonicum TaxID=375 RepID=A0A1Y2JAI6_BRAJP|nr:hypothetical protein BSZ19_43125 [Bradyrhizobium japonicum]